MDIYTLLKYIQANVPTFTKLEIINEGTAFHYTPHWDKISLSKKIMGAPIDENLDRTQDAEISEPASHDLGVVFAYEDIKHAIEEGDGLDIVEFRYKQAIKAMHNQEEELTRITNEDISKINPDHINEEHPFTIMILTTDIISFDKID